MIEGKTETFLEELSTEELQKEIDKRKEEERKAFFPKPIASPDIKPLQAICQKYIEKRSKGSWDSELTQPAYFIFETAMETVFGKEVWKFINSIN